MRVFDLPLDDGQTMLADSLDRYVADHAWPEWAELADALGLTAVGVPQDAGGVGGGAVDRALIMAGLATTLRAPEWLAHHLSASLIADAHPAHPLLADLAIGHVRVALVTGLDARPAGDGWAFAGRADVVAGADSADWLILMADAAIALVPAASAGIDRRARVMIDGTMAADVALAITVDGAAMLATGPLAADLGAWIGDARLTALCAEACGLMAHMLAATVDYMGQRRQFGVPIASFQVLRHRVADMQMAMMKAVALTELAILAEDADDVARAHATSAACVETADAVRFVGENAVQIHGAMGLTEELSLGGRYKRGLAIIAAIGPLSRHLARHAAA